MQNDRERLAPSRLASLPASVGRPAYDRAALRPGIVHLGIGAFHRAHQAPVTEAAMAATGDLRWGIVGVSLRSRDTRDALAPQHGLYTLAIRDGDEQGRPRERLQIVGAVLRVLVASEDIHAVLEQIAHPDTRVISLTITEKGYAHEPATGRLRTDDPDIRHDLANPQSPRSAMGVLVYGLQRRQARGLAPVTLLSCDNLPANGQTLRGLVLAFARQVSGGLADWIAAQCTFPNAMVDRIVPRTSDEDRARVAASLSVQDAWPVVGEPFLEWVIEDHFAAGRPAWELAGARLVRDVVPYEHLKLRMVNGPQSALAYLGAVAGIATNNQAVAQPWLRAFVDAMIREEVAPTLCVPGVDLDDFRTRLLVRLANPALPHRCQQIAMDGSQKVPPRLLATIRQRRRQGGMYRREALAVAAWLHYLRGVDEHGNTYAIHDPLAPDLTARLAAAESARPGDACHVAAQAAAYAPVFGDLGGDTDFVRQLGSALQLLRRQGVKAAVAAYA